MSASTLTPVPAAFLTLECTTGPVHVRLRPDQLALLCHRLARAVGAALAISSDEPRLREVVTDLLRCFFRAGGRSDDAAHDATTLVAALAIDLDAVGMRSCDVAQVFRAVQPVVVGALAQLVDAPLSGEAMSTLRLEAQRYLHLVCTATTGALHRENERRSRSGARSRASRLPSRTRVLVAVGGVVPEGIRTLPGVLPGETPSEVFLPADVEVGALEGLAVRQVVVGPVTRAGELDESLRLVRRAAWLLGDGHVLDVRAVVPCTEMLGQILVSGDSLMAGLLARKHLAVLAQMRAPRRNDLALTLLRWVESPGPANQLARQMGVPPQTLHCRLNKLRELFGAKLDDPLARLEMIVALRTTLPAWDVVV